MSEQEHTILDEPTNFRIKIAIQKDESQVSWTLKILIIILDYYVTRGHREK
jgi:hypothetical protein